MLGILSCFRSLPQRLLRAMTSNQNYALIFYFHRYAGLIFRCFMKTISPIMLVGANLLILFVAATYIVYLLPSFYKYSGLYCGVQFVVGLFFLVNVLFNYNMCAATPAGSPPACDDPGKFLGYYSCEVDGRQIHQLNKKLYVAPAVVYKYCKHCKVIKPPRAHHCSVSGKCILNMDHFCPWMNNTVGYYNYRYFLLFMLYLCGGALYYLCVAVPLFTTLDLSQAHKKSVEDGPFLERHKNSFVIFTVTIAVSAWLSVLMLGLWHVFLLLTNQTTIEFYLNMDERAEMKKMGLVFKNPYHRGTRKNIRRVFGDVGFVGALAISSREPVEPEFPWLPTKSVYAMAIEYTRQMVALQV